MDPSLDEQILNAIELFHYSYKFRDSTFAIVVHDIETLRSILPDIRVFQSSRIKTIICARASTELEERLGRWRLRGHAFEYHHLGAGQTLADLPKQLVELGMLSGQVPVVAFEDQETVSFSPCRFYDLALASAELFEARKIFFPGPFHGLLVDGECRSHPSPAEVHELLAGNAVLNMSRAFLEYVSRELAETKIEIVVLEAKAGALFQEVFSHRGAGTLFTSEYPTTFRRACPSDVADIALVMKPYIKAGFILPVTEPQIFDSLNDYYVYTMNGQIVASAKLSEYGECAEVGKICTLPRYQRKGRARAITEKVIEVARHAGKRWVFSLSTQDRMFVFFRQLGFREIPREELPAAWQADYNFSRSSRAFRLDL
jgi:N-acetylglutamate synthase-like GNAT family acetyltransferase